MANEAGWEESTVTSDCVETEEKMEVEEPEKKDENEER